MRTKEEYHREKPTWCVGCGLYGIFDALKRAAASLDQSPERMVMVTGIGCHGRMNNYFRSYGFHGLHGRVMPVAQGIKLANPGLSVIGVSGDGDAYSIGLGHFIHALRRNISLTYLVANNQIYALTDGQTSPTSQMGFVSVSTPFGSKELPLDGAKLAMATGGTFIARGFSGNAGHLASLIEKGLTHPGFALIDILSPCVTHNKVNTYDWYRENTFVLDDDPAYNPRDKKLAYNMICDAKKIPVGLIYREEGRPPYETAVLPDPGRPLAADDLSLDTEKLGKIVLKFR